MGRVGGGHGWRALLISVREPVSFRWGEASALLAPESLSQELGVARRMLPSCQREYCTSAEGPRPRAPFQYWGHRRRKPVLSPEGCISAWGYLLACPLSVNGSPQWGMDLPRLHHRPEVWGELTDMCWQPCLPLVHPLSDLAITLTLPEGGMMTQRAQSHTANWGRETGLRNSRHAQEGTSLPCCI